jgi:hypothetical protein
MKVYMPVGYLLTTGEIHWLSLQAFFSLDNAMDWVAKGKFSDPKIEIRYMDINIGDDITLRLEEVR